MFDAINKFFLDRLGPDQPDTDANRLQVATCVLLLEVAHADDDFSAEELATIHRLMARRFDLSEDEAARLVTLAGQERLAQDDLYSFCRLVNESYPRARKLAVLELLWEVVYSDGVLENHEDALMHKMGTLLGVRHEELMALKVRVKQRLGL